MSSIFTAPGGPVAGRVGPNGPDGPRGASGPTGPNGTNGRNGVSGPSGPYGGSGPSGPSGSTGPPGVFTLPSIVVNPSGAQKIFIVGNPINDFLNRDSQNQILVTQDNGITWQVYSVNTPSNLRCCACNSSSLLMGGSYVYKNNIQNNTNVFITFAGSGNIIPPSLLGVYALCTRIIWWPDYKKFLIVLRYNVSGNYTFRIWSVSGDATNATLIYSGPTPSASASNDVVDINVNGMYARINVLNYSTLESSATYSLDGGISWTSNSAPPYTEYMSVLPYYQDSWLQFSAGEYRFTGAPLMSYRPTKVLGY
jgi:hypothetical protein